MPDRRLNPNHPTAIAQSQQNIRGQQDAFHDIRRRSGLGVPGAAPAYGQAPQGTGSDAFGNPIAGSSGVHDFVASRSGGGVGGGGSSGSLEAAFTGQNHAAGMMANLNQSMPEIAHQPFNPQAAHPSMAQRYGNARQLTLAARQPIPGNANGGIGITGGAPKVAGVAAPQAAAEPLQSPDVNQASIAERSQRAQQPMGQFDPTGGVVGPPKMLAQTQIARPTTPAMRPAAGVPAPPAPNPPGANPFQPHIDQAMQTARMHLKAGNPNAAMDAARVAQQFHQMGMEQQGAPLNNQLKQSELDMNQQRTAMMRFQNQNPAVAAEAENVNVPLDQRQAAIGRAQRIQNGTATLEDHLINEGHAHAGQAKTPQEYYQGFAEHDGGAIGGDLGARARSGARERFGEQAYNAAGTPSGSIFGEDPSVAWYNQGQQAAVPQEMSDISIQGQPPAVKKPKQQPSQFMNDLQAPGGGPFSALWNSLMRPQPAPFQR